MKRNDDISTVSVQVSPAIREYILSINLGSDILMVGRESLLWGIVKMQLDLIPSGYRPVPTEGRTGEIRIALLKSRCDKVFNVNLNKVAEINTLFRNYLTASGQKAVCNYLDKQFHQTFRAYMGGALNNNPDLSIHEAIYEFASDYNIELEHISYDALRKDWYRFKKRNQDEPGFAVERKNL